MIFIIYSETTEQSVVSRLGDPEYSYFFVLKEFTPLLEALGRVVVVENPRSEVDPIFHEAERRGEPCIFLSFSPPHRTPLSLACPTVPVFAWEFDTIPNETWFCEPEQDWRLALNKLGRAIVHSSHTVDAVRAEMGTDFPIASIPAPVWDRFAPRYRKSQRGFSPAGVTIPVTGKVIDTRGAGTVASAITGRTDVVLDGVVYLSIFNPQDGRKNLPDMVGGFCEAFREIEDATLVLKLTHRNLGTALSSLKKRLKKLMPFKCRIVVLAGYLNSGAYEKLVSAASYAVNVSRGEGQCLPLMELMACGKPAIAPKHTGMADYIDEDNAFLVGSSAELTGWPQDPRGAYRTFSRRIDSETVVNAYRDSYRIAKNEPEHYARMGSNAHEALRRHCARDVTVDRIMSFLAQPASPEKPNTGFGGIRTKTVPWMTGMSADLRVLAYGDELDAITLSFAGCGAKVDAVYASARSGKALQALAKQRDVVLSSYVGIFGFNPDDAGAAYDFVLFGESYRHCVAQDSVVAGLRDMLAPGGKILMGCDQNRGPFSHWLSQNIRWRGDTIKPLPKWRRPEFLEDDLVRHFAGAGFVWRTFNANLDKGPATFYEFRNRTQSLDHLRDRPVPCRSDTPPATAGKGILHALKRNADEVVWPGMMSVEMFRSGDGWWCPEDWGTWTKPGGGELVFRIKGPHSPLRGYFWLNGLQRETSGWSLELDLSAPVAVVKGSIGAGEAKWVICEFRESDGDTVVHVRVRGEAYQDLSRLTDGADPRLTSIGVRGFYICEATDTIAREDFAEAILLNDPDRLMPRANFPC
jgi:glycosyltransferase involved in cell wall biosynthesis